jgi:hypothetical protein
MGGKPPPKGEHSQYEPKLERIKSRMDRGAWLQNHLILRALESSKTTIRGLLTLGHYGDFKLVWSRSKDWQWGRIR